jgi:hypothetical protein
MCKESGCSEEKLYARGLCHKHYDKYRLSGTFIKVETNKGIKGVRLTNEDFKNRIKDKHFGDIICLDYFKGSRDKIHKFKRLSCGHIWETRAVNVLAGSGCPKCNSQSRVTSKEYKLRLEDTDFILLGEYIDLQTRTLHRCKNEHELNLTPTSILHFRGTCSVCEKKKTSGRYAYSNLAVQFLNQLSFCRGIKIQHAELGGELKIRIGSRRFSADGFNKKLNAVIEFNGDCFHGNPKKYSPDEYCHPFRKNKTAGELWEETLEKKRLLKLAGYKVISVWESDYLANPVKTLVRASAQLH